MKKYMIIGFVAVLAISSVAMTVATATSGAEVSALRRQEATLSDQKISLENTLVKTLSLSQLQEKSVGLGYEKPVNLVYVAPPETVAKLP